MAGEVEPDRIHKTAIKLPKQHVDIIYSSSCDRLGDLFCPKLHIFSEKYELGNICETKCYGHKQFIFIHVRWSGRVCIKRRERRETDLLLLLPLVKECGAPVSGQRPFISGQRLNQYC